MWSNLYYSWLAERTVECQFKEIIEVNTPFLNKHNDFIALYVDYHDDAYIEIRDDGDTLNDASINIGKKELWRILKQYNVLLYIKNNELAVEATKKNFGEKMHSLIQAILAINAIACIGD